MWIAWFPKRSLLLWASFCSGVHWGKQPILKTQDIIRWFSHVTSGFLPRYNLIHFKVSSKYFYCKKLFQDSRHLKHISLTFRLFCFILGYGTYHPHLQGAELKNCWLQANNLLRKLLFFWTSPITHALRMVLLPMEQHLLQPGVNGMVLSPSHARMQTKAAVLVHSI